MFESYVMSVTPTRKRTKYSGSLEKGLLESLMKDKSPRICLLSVQGKSDVWSLFKRIVLDDEETRYVQCQECGNIMIHDNSTGTGGLKRHNCLPKQRKAMAQLVNAVSPSAVQWKKENPLALDVSTTSRDTSSPKNQTQSFKSKLVNSSLLNPVEPLSVHLKKEMSKLGALCIAKDLKPYNFMEGNGFELLAQNLINIGAKFGNIDAKQLLPNAVTISKSVSEIYDKLKESLRNELKLVKACGLVCDSRVNPCDYISINVRYFKNDHLVTKVLDVFKSEDEDLFKLAVHVNNVLEEFDIIFKVKICVCENAALFSSSSLPQEWVSCAARNLNLVLYHTFESIKDDPSLEAIHSLLCSSQQLVTFWKDNGLNEAQIKLEAMIDDRLDSIVDMLQSISRYWIQLMEIRERNEKIKCYLDAIDKNLLNHLVNILSPFKELRETLCDDKGPTFHLVLPTKAKLIKKCDPFSLDDGIILKLKEKLRQNIECHFQVSIFHKCATLLVPSFRGLKNMATNYEREEIYETLKKLEQEWHKNSSSSSSSSSSSFKEYHLSKNNGLESIFDSLFDSQSSSIETGAEQSQPQKQEPSNASSETYEYERYLKDNLTSSELRFSPIEFWEFKKSLYPALYEVTKWLLSNPASSFSNVSNLRHDLEENLISLDPGKLNQLFFIRSNIECT